MGIMPVIKQNLSDNIKIDLKNYILSMNLKENTKLPPEIEISQSLGVSRVTVRRALEELEQEHLIFRIHGRGTFVNTEAVGIKISLNPAQEFEQLIALGGFQSSIRLISFENTTADKKTAAYLQIAEKSPLFRIEKAYYADGHPAICCIDMVPKHIFKEMPEKDTWAELSTYQILKQYAGRILLRDRIELLTNTKDEMAQVTPFARHMECGSVLLLDTLTYDQDNQPILSGSSYFDTKYIRYNLLRNQSVY